MRLIDADELPMDIEWSDVENAPTIDAIPIEWLLNNIPIDSVMWEYNKKLIEYLVIGWREEKETEHYEKVLEKRK